MFAACGKSDPGMKLHPEWYHETNGGGLAEELRPKVIEALTKFSRPEITAYRDNSGGRKGRHDPFWNVTGPIAMRWVMGNPQRWQTSR